jgi:lysine 6-dehydrogenase
MAHIKDASILAIGGSGAMGRAATKLIADCYGPRRLTVADFDLEAAQSWAQQLQESFVDAAFIDLGEPETFGGRFRDYDLVLNLAPYRFNKAVMEGSLAGDCHYVDLGGLFHMTNQQLPLDPKFQAIGKTAVLGMGASPGMANLAAEVGAREMDQVREIHIRTGSKGSAGGFPYSPITVLEEATLEPRLFTGGELKAVEPLSGEQTYRMPEPIGEVLGFYSIHSELATLPFRYPGIQEVSFRVAFSTELVQGTKTLVAFGLTRRDPLDLGGGASLSPWDFLITHFETFPRASGVSEKKSLRVTTLGKKDGKDHAVQYEVLVDSRPDWGLTATAVWTGFPAAVATKLILEGKTPAGAQAPEALFEPEDILPELAAVGCAIVRSPEEAVIRNR